MKPSLLSELEARAHRLAEEEAKHDPQFAYDALADWVRQLGHSEQHRLHRELRTWLRDTEHAWRQELVLELALSLGSRDLLDAGVDEARSLRRTEADRAGELTPWRLFHLVLLSVMHRWPGDLGPKAGSYLAQLSAEVAHASDYSQRQVGIRARLIECFRAASPPRRECLEAALTLLRSWQDEGLHISALALLDHELNRSPQGLAELGRSSPTRSSWASG